MTKDQEEKIIRYTQRMPESTYKKIKKLAKNSHMSVNSFVLSVVEDMLKSMINAENGSTKIYENEAIFLEVKEPDKQ